MDKLKCLLVALFSSVLMITGCVRVDINTNENPKEDTTINKEDENNKEEKPVVEEDEKDVDTVDKNDDNTNDKDDIVSNMNEVYFDISSLDVDSGEKIVIGSLKLDESKSIEDKLSLLLKEISKLRFDNAPIKLIKIENNIAYVDLEEGKDKNYWSTGYFQGSTGGSITTYTLTESILQRSYTGQWIDGVCFSYEGKTDMEFDHLGMDFFGSVIKR